MPSVGYMDGCLKAQLVTLSNRTTPYWRLLTQTHQLRLPHLGTVALWEGIKQGPSPLPGS